MRAINALRSPTLDAIARPLNGWGFFLLPLVALITALVCRKRHVAAAARDIILSWYVATTLAEDVIKLVIHRARPTAIPALRASLHVLGRVPPATSYAFPSGTAAAVFAASTSIWIAGGERYGIAATVFATLVSLTRVYVGVHYPSDLLGGAILGAATAWVVHRASKWIAESPHKK